jgi:hypothetical protein
MSLTLGSEQIPLERDDSGTIRIGKTRVTLESVAYAFEEGNSAESIQDSVPQLNSFRRLSSLGETVMIRRPNLEFKGVACARIRIYNGNTL